MASKLQRRHSPLDIASKSVDLASVADPTFQRTSKIDVDMMEPDPAQPRRQFDPAKLQQLGESMKRVGQLQAIVLEPHPGKAGRYIIKMGERRWRAAPIAELTSLYAVVRQPGTTDRFAQLAENLHRDDLSALEIAEFVRNVIAETGIGQEEAAKLAGLDPTALSRHLALLDLPDAVLAEYRELSDEIPKSLMFELVTLPADRQIELWPLVRGGEMTVKAMRAAKAAGRTPNGGDEAAVNRGGEGMRVRPFAKLYQKAMAATRLNLTTIGERRAELLPEQRRELQDLKTMIDALLAEE